MERLTAWWNSKKEHATTFVTPVVAVGSIVSGYMIGRYIYDQVSRKYHNYPPGPSGYPFIGSGIEFGTNGRSFFKQLYKNDKKVSMFYLFTEPWIVIHDISIVKNHFNKIEFSNRTENPGMWILRSILNSNYQDSHSRRQVMVQALISQAQRSTRLYQLIGKSIEIDMFNKINNCIKTGNKWDIRNEAQFVTFSTIYASTIGESINSKDETFQQFTESLAELFHAWKNAVLVDSLTPDWVDTKLKIDLPGIAQFREAQRKLVAIVQKWTNEKVGIINKQISENGTIDTINSGAIGKDDYIGQLVLLSKKENIDVNKMLSDIVLAFFAGTHTTATSIEQGILYLAQNPEMQERIYNQLIEDKLHLKENYGNLKLLQKCHVLKAFVYETLRFNGLILCSIQRSSAVTGHKAHNKNIQKPLQIKFFDDESETEKMYNVPPNGVVVMNIWQMSTQFDKFGNNGFKFDLNNWLTKDNQFNDSKFLAIFGYGNRNCAGQLLAKNELYLVLGLLILNYKFIPPNGIKPQNFKIPLGFAQSNTPLGVCCVKR